MAVCKVICDHGSRFGVGCATYTCDKGNKIVLLTGTTVGVLSQEIDMSDDALDDLSRAGAHRMSQLSW